MCVSLCLSQVLRNFCVLRKLDGQIWPPSFEAAAATENKGPRGRLNGGNMLLLQPNERSLLTALLARLQVRASDTCAYRAHVLLICHFESGQVARRAQL